MTTKTLRTDVDGTIPTLRVIGFHGRLGADQTPARRLPVYADSKGHLVTVLEASPAAKGRFALTVEVGSRKIAEDIWERTGTRIDPPWPACLGEIVVIIGARELGHAQRLLGGSVPDDQPRRLTEFLRWLTTNTDRSEQLRCARVEELVAWSCTLEEATALFGRIADLARQQVIDFAHRGDAQQLRSASFWLSRAAVDDADMYLAVAGLRQASSPHWEALLEAGVRTGTRTRRLAAVDAAAQRLAAPTVDRGPLPSPFALARSRAARRAVFSSVEDLAAAAQRAALRAA